MSIDPRQPTPSDLFVARVRELAQASPYEVFDTPTGLEVGLRPAPLPPRVEARSWAAHLTVLLDESARSFTVYPRPMRVRVAPDGRVETIWAQGMPGRGELMWKGRHRFPDQQIGPLVPDDGWDMRWIENRELVLRAARDLGWREGASPGRNAGRIALGLLLLMVLFLVVLLVVAELR